MTTLVFCIIVLIRVSRVVGQVKHFLSFIIKLPMLIVCLVGSLVFMFNLVRICANKPSDLIRDASFKHTLLSIINLQHFVFVQHFVIIFAHERRVQRQSRVDTITVHKQLNGKNMQLHHACCSMHYHTYNNAALRLHDQPKQVKLSKVKNI